MVPEMALNINPVRLIRSLSMALELAVSGASSHHWRTAVLCRYLAEAMGLDLSEKQTLLMAALLHDIGAASDFNERRRIMSLGRLEDLGIYAHAESGYRLLNDSCCFQPLAEAVRHHHDRWMGGNPSGLARDAIPRASRIIHLADKMEISIDPASPLNGQRDDLLGLARDSAGSEQDPEAVDALLSASEKDCFWLDLSNPSYADILFRDMDSWGLSNYTSEDMLSIAEVYASIIDRMSLFTATHSRSVSKVSKLLASHCGFCKSELDMMETAGLLHDLGKLTIPNAILEKPGRLAQHEMRLMRQHTFHTYRILEQVGNLHTVAQWGAFHHETLDGNGYPFRLGENDLSLGSRIMAVADIFVALAENRPYRNRLDSEAVKNIMRGMIERGKIDGRLVDILFDIYPQADEIILSAAV